MKLKHQNAFACFLFFLERKYSQTVSVIVFQLVSEKLSTHARKSLLSDSEDDESQNKVEALKKEAESQIKLITLYVLLNEHSEFQFKRLIKTSESLKIARGMVESFKEVHFFSWLLIKKMHDKTLKPYKVLNLGENNLVTI